MGSVEAASTTVATGTGRGRNVVAADWLTRDEVTKAKEVLASHVRGEKGARYLMLPDIRTP